MTAMFRVFLAILVMVGAFAQTASAQSSQATTEPTATTTAQTEPKPVPATDFIKSVVGFSQGVGASWGNTGPNGEQEFINFYLSGGWDYEQFQYPRSAPTTSWRVNTFWFSYSRVSCPSEGGYCQTKEEDYGPATAGDFTFYGNERVKFTGAGYIFTFTADPSFPEGMTQEFKHNQTTGGAFCWYSRQNAMRLGTADLSLPNGSVMPTTRGSSAWYDWKAEHEEGQEVYTPSCAPYYGGGGKG